MDNSTEGVTLFCGFVFDVVGHYEDMGSSVEPLLEFMKGLDRDNPTAPCPMKVYNDACEWIEQNMGQASIRAAGRHIGVRVFEQLTAWGELEGATQPHQIMQLLKKAADAMIQDPKGRGWIVEIGEGNHIKMIRTQTFNCMLQEGLLQSLLKHTKVMAPRIEHVKCTRRGDEFCEYDCTWG